MPNSEISVATAPAIMTAITRRPPRSELARDDAVVERHDACRRSSASSRGPCRRSTTTSPGPAIGKRHGDRAAAVGLDHDAAHGSRGSTPRTVASMIASGSSRPRVVGRDDDHVGAASAADRAHQRALVGGPGRRRTRTPRSTGRRSITRTRGDCSASSQAVGRVRVVDDHRERLRSASRPARTGPAPAPQLGEAGGDRRPASMPSASRRGGRGEAVQRR